MRRLALLFLFQPFAWTQEANFWVRPSNDDFDPRSSHSPALG